MTARVRWITTGLTALAVSLHLVVVGSPEDHPAAPGVAAASVTGPPPSGTTPPAGPAGSPGTGTPPRVQLPDEASGRRAVRLLGDQISEAARLNDLTTRGLRDLLLEDPSAWVATTGQVHFKDPLPSGGTGADVVVEPSAPLTDTFRLHSTPGAARTIFLDFDGHTVTDSYWNSQYGVGAGPHPAWSLDSDPGFSDRERGLVQNVWQRVAEDFAPFDVDVTTEAPAESALLRSGSTDPAYGVRVLISPSTQAAAAICNAGCGGVAFLDVFAKVTSRPAYQPAWVFPQQLNHSAKSVADAASHEVGHTLALTHDGSSTTSYYAGHGTWAPLMGSSYRSPISQWSRGGYPAADNAQDDLAVISSHGAPARPDEAGSQVGAAAAPPVSGTAYITSDADVDVFALGTCEGSLSVTARPATVSPNLDLRLRLLSEDGSVVATADPASTAGDPWWDVVSGMDATLHASDVSGRVLVSVEGTGNGTSATGYDGYGSVGAYTLDPVTCEQQAPGVPAAPKDVSATAASDGRSALLTWSDPVASGDLPVTSYVLVHQGDGTRLTRPADVTTELWTGLSPGATHTFTVTAVNAAGPGPASSTTVVMPDLPGPPTGVSASPGVAGGRLTAAARWKPPAWDGGSVVTGYRVVARKMRANGTVARTVTSSTLPPTARSLSMRLGRGRWSFVVSARNQVGSGALSSPSPTVRAR